MDSFLSLSPRHGLEQSLEQSLEPGMQRDSKTVGNPSADRLGPGDMIGHSDQLDQFNNPLGTETLGAQRRYGPHPMALGTAQWSSSYQNALPDHVIYANPTTSMSDWATEPCMTNQSPGSDPTLTAFSNDGEATTHNSMLREISVHPARVYSWDHHQPRGTLPGNQEQRQSASTEVGNITSGPNGRTIGVVFENRKFACVLDACNGTTFSRRVELERHYRERHDPNRQDLWCHIPNCNHYEFNGGKAFTRPDKLRAHMRNKHNYYL